MDEEAKKLKELIESSGRILITSHISPDPDSVSSIILLGTTLKFNYPEKAIDIVLEDRPVGLDFIEGFNQINFGPVLDALKAAQPDLFIMLDGNNYERASRHDGGLVRQVIKDIALKTVIIDHHEEDGRDQVDLYINNQSPAAALDVYEICFDELGLKQPAGAIQTAMTGFYADTGGFVYVKAGQQEKLFKFAERLVSMGANIESVKYALENYSLEDAQLISSLLSNLSTNAGYSFSYLSDDFVNSWINSGKSQLEFQKPTNAFLNQYIRNINGNKWGFIVFKNTLQGDNYYSVSFRSQNGEPDVSKYEANSLKDALAKIEHVIGQPA
jgi:phosphoesterase RecJ-like protein